MPNVALMIGAGLIGALVAGLFLLYNDDHGFGNNQRSHSHSYGGNNDDGFSNNRRWREPSTHPNSNNKTQNAKRNDNKLGTNDKRRRRRDEEDEPCIICCDTLSMATVYTIIECGHRFHTKCLQRWVEAVCGSDPNRACTCPHCRGVMENPLGILNLSG